MKLGYAVGRTLAIGALLATGTAMGGAAMADPLDFETIATIRNFTGCDVETALASEGDILDAIDKLIDAAETIIDAMPEDGQ